VKFQCGVFGVKECKLVSLLRYSKSAGNKYVRVSTAPDGWYSGVLRNAALRGAWEQPTQFYAVYAVHCERTVTIKNKLDALFLMMDLHGPKHVEEL
jgi:hypothetical protein